MNSIQQIVRETPVPREGDASWFPPELSVVVPTYNERGNVELLYSALSTALAGIRWELIVVDDDSPDGTADAVKALAMEHPNLHCIRRVGRRGLSSACIEGISASAAPFVAVMDADHQHDEKILPQMLDAARRGADMVIGSRFAKTGSTGEGLSASRLWGSKLATRLSAFLTGRQVADPMSGFFLLERSLFDRLADKLTPDGFKILLDLIVTARGAGEDLVIAEIPYKFRARNAGVSKMSPLIAIQFLGLWMSKLTGGLVPATFLLFGMVGASGIAVHLASLSLFHYSLGFNFINAQIAATLVAMTWNFFLNNVLTYSDRRLRGGKLIVGLLGFYLVCSFGALANLSFAAWVYAAEQPPVLAGLAGAIMSSVFNYAVTRLVTWR